MSATLQRFVCTHGEIAYAWSHGPQPDALVVLHGLGDSSLHTCSPVFENGPLWDTPALFIDLPGFGMSSASSGFDGSLDAHAQAVVDLLAHLRLDRAPVFAHSMGANIAILIAHRCPGLFSRMALAEPLLHPDHSVIATRVARFPLSTYLDHGHAMVMRATRQQAGRGDVSAISYLPNLGMADPRIMHAAATSLIHPRTPPFSELLHSLQPDVVLLIGQRTRDSIGDLPLKETPVIDIPDSGHFIIVEQPLLTSYAILKAVWGPRMKRDEQVDTMSATPLSD